MEIGVLSMAIHVFYGTDEYRKERAFRALRKQVVNSELGALTHHVLDDPSFSQLLETLNTSFFALGGLPVVEVHHWQGLYDLKEDDKARVPELIEALEAQAEQKDIIFLSTKLDVRMKLGKWIKSHKASQLHVFDTPAFWDAEKAVHLLMEECQLLEIRLSRDAAFLLVEFMGNDLRPLINECEKLHAFTNAQVIEAHHVRSFSVLDAQTFSVVDAWLQKRLTHRSMHDLNALLVNDAPIKFLALLSSRVNYYYRIKRGLAVGQSLDEIAQVEGKKVFPIQKDLEKVRGLSLANLEVLKRRLLEVEFRLKSGEDNPALVLEQLMLT
ncbi:MAG: hypothetical protein LW809_03235 [Vampirovibrionales bacterium]|nr:hypothetical protein [Vampirovibrionales bacterium]